MRLYPYIFRLPWPTFEGDCPLRKEPTIDAELESLTQEMELLAEMTKKCIEENSRNVQDQDEFAAKYNRLVEWYEATKTKAKDLQTQRSLRQNKAEKIGAFMFTLHEMETAAQKFAPKLWMTTVSQATVYSDGRIAFRFISGMEITA